MVKARLIWVVLLASAVTAIRSEDIGVEVAEASFTEGPECRSADCASPLLAHSDEGPSFPAARTIDVAGRYTVTSTRVLMPGTEGALRVIEFTAEGAGGQEAP